MSAHSQHLLALARQQFSAFKGAAERELLREKGRCLRQHCAQIHTRLQATIRKQPRAVAAVLNELFPQKKKPVFPESLFTPKAQQSKSLLFPEIKPTAPAPSKMPTLTPEQRRTFKH